MRGEGGKRECTTEKGSTAEHNKRKRNCWVWNTQFKKNVLAVALPSMPATSTCNDIRKTQKTNMKDLALTEREGEIDRGTH